MKKIILFYVLFCIFGFDISAQNYIPFPDSNAVWSMRRAKFSVKGDTLLAGRFYKKYYVQWDPVNYNFDFAKATYYAGVREDSQRIYAWHRLDTTERLLYDFNVNVLDTVTTWILPFDYMPSVSPVFYSNKYMVNGVYSLQLDGGIVTKCIELYDDIWGTPTIWYSGIGSSLGPFISGVREWSVIDYLLEKTLLCYENDSMTIHFFPPNINSDSCFSNEIVKMDEYPVSEKPIRIYPNPFSTHVFIETKYIKDKNCNISIYSVHGSLLFRKETTTCRILDLDLENKIPEGLYILLFEFDQISTTFLIQKIK